MIERTFQNIPDGKLGEADRQSFLIGLGWSGGTTWQDLLRSRRVLMISEAGAGKTHECREQAQRLWDAGEPAFFVALSALATGDLGSQLNEDEEARLCAWISSQSDVATFFLDSIDELKLSLGSFEQALKRFRKAIRSQLGRARIVMTTRPIPFDRRRRPAACSSNIAAHEALRESAPLATPGDIPDDRRSCGRVLRPAECRCILQVTAEQHGIGTTARAPSSGAIQFVRPRVSFQRKISLLFAAGLPDCQYR